MSRALLSLGSNLGDRKEMLKRAVERLSFATKLVQMSNVYETHVEHGGSSDTFLNCAVEIETDMDSLQLLQCVIEIQEQLSETSDGEPFVRKNVDIDIVAFDREIIRTPRLTLPHPSAYRRAFVMIPLAEINPEWIHPVLNKTAYELARQAYWPGWGSFFAPGESLDPK